MLFATEPNTSEMYTKITRDVRTSWARVCVRQPLYDRENWEEEVLEFCSTPQLVAAVSLFIEDLESGYRALRRK